MNKLIEDINYMLYEGVEEEPHFDCCECGEPLYEDDSICRHCGFSFSELIHCPCQKNEVCIIDNEECSVSDFDYEHCEKYRKKT